MQNSVDDPDQLVHDRAYDLHLSFACREQAIAKGLDLRAAANQVECGEVEGFAQSAVSGA